MNLNIVNYETTRHSICFPMFSYYLLRRDVVKESCLKNQEILRNSRFLNSRQEIQCQEICSRQKIEIFYLENQDKKS